MAQHDIDRVARGSFGIETLKPEQREAIEAAVAGRDVLAVLATGYGKSAVYQIATAVRGGCTVVISPLIALQEDQVAGLEDAPDAPQAVALNSTHGARERKDAWRRLREGGAAYVLLAPEQLAKEDVREGLADIGVSLLVVDEAHCVSSWGHDFRPDYLMIGEMAERLGRPPIVALTATASTPVRDEIAERLGLRGPAVIVGDMDRPEIRFAVHRHADDRAKRAAVLDEVAALHGPGLLYTATRRDAERYAAELGERGVRARAYHAGLPAAERAAAHEAFLDGSVDVVTATSAFGMGIDKPDVRFVVHADAPESVDAYYQEVGRAGRDGERAQATLHYRPEDLALRRFFATKAPAPAELGRIWDALAGGRMGRRALAQAAGVAPRRLTALLALLEDTGSVRLDRRGVTARPRRDRETAVRSALERVEDRERIDRSRVDMLRGYAETRRCRRQVLLAYFGRELDEPCGRCDTCETGSATQADGGAHAAAAPCDGGFAVDERVQHREWGDGIVVSVEEDRITAFFDTAGYRQLSRALLAEGDLLERVPA